MKKYVSQDLSCVRRIWDGIPSSCGCRKRNRKCGCTAPQEEDYNKENYAPGIKSPYNLYEGSSERPALLFFHKVKPIIDWNMYYKETPHEIFYAEKRSSFVDEKGNIVNEGAWYFSETQSVFSSFKALLPYFFTKYEPSHRLWKYSLKMADLREDLESASRVFGRYDDYERNFTLLKRKIWIND